MESVMKQQSEVKRSAHRGLMNPQLRWITCLLDENEVPYWLDSGTLLGLVREGDVMDHDKDIDLAVWVDDMEKVQALFDEFEQGGYRVKTGVYEGMIYNFLLVPKSGDGITVSIGVNRRHGDKVWRMATFVKDNPHPRWGLRFLLQGVWRFPIRQSARFVSLFGVPRARLITIWPYSRVFGSGVWIFPWRYVEETALHEPTGLPIPSKWSAYLTYRYGNWREPVRDWAWYRDDHAAHLGDPVRLVKRSTAVRADSSR